MVQRGDVWWADLDAPSESEPGSRRPVIVIQANPFNESLLPTVLVLAVTSNLKLADAPGTYCCGSAMRSYCVTAWRTSLRC